VSAKQGGKDYPKVKYPGIKQQQCRCERPLPGSELCIKCGRPISHGGVAKGKPV